MVRASSNSSKTQAQDSSSKKSVIEYRSTKDISSLYGVLGEIERSVADMTRVFTELPESGQRDVGGREKLSTRQQEVLAIIAQSQRRADEIVRLIKKIQG